MKTQQQAEREEQQRIKNLVLNYDLQQSDDQDGECTSLPSRPWPFLHVNSLTCLMVVNDRPTTFYHNRVDKPNKGQRVRKLQLSDVDW